MEFILEAIQNILRSISEPTSELLPIFPGTIITIMVLNIMARKRILSLYHKFIK